MKGRLHLIPVTLGDTDAFDVIPPKVLDQVLKLDTFVVEDTRSARRFLSAIGFRGKIETLQFIELNLNTPPSNLSMALELLKKGKDIGLMSEAGVPAVADPGSDLVILCHNNEIDVIPYVGPSSILLALMASGKSGQHFTFNGYLPINKEERKSKLKELERISERVGVSQIFMETPYRNNSLLDDIINCCNESSTLTIATQITLPDQFISTKSIKEWKKSKPDLNKKPTIFIL